MSLRGWAVQYESGWSSVLCSSARPSLFHRVPPQSSRYLVYRSSFQILHKFLVQRGARVIGPSSCHSALQHARHSSTVSHRKHQDLSHIVFPFQLLRSISRTARCAYRWALVPSSAPALLPHRIAVQLRIYRDLALTSLSPPVPTCPLRRLPPFLPTHSR